jgi:Fe-S-cluster-containing hydrogenase component 2
MNDCPVDAIHRGKESLEIRIENHCIGCGLCERNCPYGSIQMVPNPDVKAKALPGATGLIAQPSRKALNCDLCQGLIDRGEDTFCVHACPHEAAFRFTDSRATQSGGREERAGEKLMRLVTEKTRR